MSKKLEEIFSINNILNDNDTKLNKLEQKNLISQHKFGLMEKNYTSFVQNSISVTKDLISKKRDINKKINESKVLLREIKDYNKDLLIIKTNYDKQIQNRNYIQPKLFNQIKSLEGLANFFEIDKIISNNLEEEENLNKQKLEFAEIYAKSINDLFNINVNISFNYNAISFKINENNEDKSIFFTIQKINQKFIIQGCKPKFNTLKYETILNENINEPSSIQNAVSEIILDQYSKYSSN